MIKQLLITAGVTRSTASAFTTGEPTHDIQPNDFFSLGMANAVAMSPDGKRIAWRESRWDPQLDRTNADLWLVNNDGSNKQRLTFSNENESAPVWSPDGQWLYYSAAIKRNEDALPYNGKSQVFRINTATGAIQPVTRSTQGVGHFQLNKDGSAIYYSTGRDQVDSDHFAALRAAHKGPKYGHGKQRTNPIVRLDLTSWQTETILDDDKVVWDFAVSDDESKLARITTLDNELVHLEGWSHIEVTSLHNKTTLILEDQQWREQAPSPFGWLLGLDWSDDSQALAFRIDFDGHPGETFISEFDGDQFQRSFKLQRPKGPTLTGDDIHWRTGSRTLCYRVADRGRQPLFCSSKLAPGKASHTVVTPGDMVLYGYSFDKRGKTLAMIHNGQDHFPDLFVASANNSKGKYRRVATVNPQTADWKLPSVEIVKWTAPDGATVEGILELPPGYKKSDGPLPTIIQIHGGPTSATPYALRFRHYGQTHFAARGWAVLSPNYRGSTGYGDKFLVDLIGRENDIEVKDILAGVNYLVDNGIADNDRLAVMGWSNGGYLTNALIGTTDRFKAASSGAGNFDQLLQWIIEDTPGHVVNYMQGLPWEKPEAYRAASPLFNADKIKTPTLIHMGENDPRVPLAHAQGLYRSLKQYLNVPVELLVYPGEGHGLSKYQHRKAKMDWDLKWFEYYVLGKGTGDKK